MKVNSMITKKIISLFPLFALMIYQSLSGQILLEQKLMISLNCHGSVLNKPTGQAHVWAESRGCY